MKRILLLITLLGTMTGAWGGEKLTLTDLTNGQYGSRRISGLTPLADGESYSQLSSDRKQIVQYSFRTGEQTAVLFDVNNVKGKIRLESIDGYQMSPDESHILVQTQTRSI